MKSAYGFVKTRKGSILLLTVAGVMFFLLLMGLAVDVTYCFIVRNQLRNLADNASLAAIGEYIDQSNKGESREDALDAAIQSAQDIGTMTYTLDQPTLSITIADSDVVFGTYDQNTQTFIPEPQPDDPDTTINAVRVSVRKEGVNPRYRFYLRTITGFSDAALRAHAVSSLVRKNIIFILDISASMDNNTYPNDNRSIKPNDDIDPDGIDYYDFKTYPVNEYNFNSETLGGRPQPIYALLEIVRDFFGATLPTILDQNDNIGFLTFNLNVQDRVEQISSGQSFVIPSNLHNLGNLCQHSLHLYDDYIADSMFLSRADYNPPIHRSWIDNFQPFNSSYPKSSIVDYKYAQSGYPSGTAMYELHNDDTIIFPGGVYPSGEKVDHFLRIPGGTDIDQEGFTNMGLALETARNRFNQIMSSSDVPAFNMVILLTDGLPNVYRNFTRLGSSYYGKRYARDEANALKENGIRICTIFFKTRGADGEDFLNDYIASDASYAFTADDPDMVDTILNQIMHTFPYVLVE